MKIFAPEYYRDFRCIASRCRHNCCIGWEIDIDRATMEKYQAQTGAFGKRLRENIRVSEGVASFRLDKDDRCPFLNKEGLCDIILHSGEDSLSEICALHPRYRHFFSDRVEIGLGIACEEACRLLLQHKEPLSLVLIGEDGEREVPCDAWEKEILAQREDLLRMAQDRSMALSSRMRAILKTCGVSLFARSYAEWADFYRSLERLDGAWDTCLDRLANGIDLPDGFNECEGEQLLSYFLLRHIPDAFDAEDLACRAAFAVHACSVILALAYVGVFDMAEVARLYSSEIEYSEENTEAILDEISRFM